MIRDAGTDVRARRAINFAAGSNVTVTIADDPAAEAVDVTIDSTGGSGTDLWTYADGNLYPTTTPEVITISPVEKFGYGWTLEQGETDTIRWMSDIYGVVGPSDDTEGHFAGIYSEAVIGNDGTNPSAYVQATLGMAWNFANAVIGVDGDGAYVHVIGVPDQIYPLVWITDSAYNATFKVFPDRKVIVGAPAAAPADWELWVGSWAAWIDETADELVFKVRYSDGTIKSGSIALT